MNKSRGKLFGIFNILDILILIIVVLIIGGGIYAYGQYKSNQEANRQTVEYEVEIKEVDEKFVSAINKGDFIRESVKGNNLGRVAGTSYAQATNINEDFINGRYVIAEVPGKLDLVLKLTADANVTSRSVKVGGLDIRTGKKITIKGKGYAGEGFILKVSIKE